MITHENIPLLIDKNPDIVNRYTIPNIRDKIQRRPGLNREELLFLENDPFWKWLRGILAFTFWLLLMTMLVSAGIIIVTTPQCTSLNKTGLTNTVFDRAVLYPSHLSQ